MCLPLWSVLLLRQHSQISAGGQPTHPHTEGFVKNNGPCGCFLTKPAETTYRLCNPSFHTGHVVIPTIYLPALCICTRSIKIHLQAIRVILLHFLSRLWSQESFQITFWIVWPLLLPEKQYTRLIEPLFFSLCGPELQ